MIIISGCIKVDPTSSNEVFVSITNECSATITLYNYDDGRQYLSDIFDCDYVHMIVINVKPGKYKVKAETYLGRVIEKTFTKDLIRNHWIMSFRK
jgi:hypothetical protein